MKDRFLLLSCITAILKPSLSHVCFVMARRIHSFSLGLSLKTRFEFLVSTDAVPYLQLRKDPSFFPLPLKICCGSAPDCKQYSVSLASLPGQISSSRGRRTSGHNVDLLYSSHKSTAGLSIEPVCLLHLPSRFLQRKDAQTCKIALREANSPLGRWSRVEGANQQPALAVLLLTPFPAVRTYDRSTADCRQAAVRPIAVASDLGYVPRSIHCGLPFVTRNDVSPLN